MREIAFITPLRRLFTIERIRQSLENPKFLLKWFLISSAVGIVAGVGAIIYFEAIRLATNFFLGFLVGYLPPDPAGEGKTVVMPLWSAVRPWLLPLVVALGGLLSGLIVYTLAPEAEGDGADTAIHAFHTGGSIKPYIPVIKVIASAITLGAGGSGGREGPAAQISAGFGSLLANVLHLDAQDRRILIAVGVGSGIGAIFRAPLGGAILAGELLYLHDLETEAIVPGLIASIIAYSVFGLCEGWNPIFATTGNLAFTSPLQLSYYVVIGLICGGLGWLYARGFFGIEHFFHRLPVPRIIKPAIGGLCVGLIGLAVPQALGMGYGWVQVVMSPQGLLQIPLWIVIILPFTRILVTGLTVGSGGAAGTFGPGMVIGSMVGALIWRISFHHLPGVPDSPSPFVIVAMMALFGGVAHAPLAVMIMVAEMTGNLSILAPAMVAVGISTIIVGNTTIYRAQVPSRADSPAHRLQLTFPLLGTLTVQQAMAKLTVRFAPEQTIASAVQLLSDRPETGAPVVDARGRLLGVLTQADIQRVPVEEREKRLVREIMRKDVVVFHPSDTLDDALERLARRRVSWAPVVSLEAETGGRIVLGWLSAADIMKAYRSTLLKDTQKMGRVIRRTTRNAQARAKAEATQPLDSSVADAYMEQQQKGKTQNLSQTVNLLQTRKLQQTQKLQSQTQDGQKRETAEQEVPKK